MRQNPRDRGFDSRQASSLSISHQCALIRVLQGDATQMIYSLKIVTLLLSLGQNRHNARRFRKKIDNGKYVEPLEK